MTDEKDERPTMRDAILSTMSLRELLQRHAKSIPDDDLKVMVANVETLAAIAGRLRNAPKENTGMACPYCDQTLPRLNIQRTGEDSFDISISAPAQTAKEAEAMCKLIRQLIR